MLLVDVPVEVQIERIVSRDDSTREQAMAIVKSQATRAERQAVATDIIKNDNSVGYLHEQVSTLHKQYSALAVQ